MNGTPEMTPKSDMVASSITLTSGLSNQRIAISHKDVNEAHLTLGVYLSPTGDMTQQYQHLLEKSNKCAVRVMTSNLTRLEACLAYRTTWLPAITYSLSNTTLTKKQLEHVQMQAMGNFLTKMGLNRHFPRAVAMGPLAMGGLGLRHLPTEQGIQQIHSLLGHIFNNTIPIFIQIALQNQQVEAGTETLLVTDTTPDLSYLTPTWITSLRGFLRPHQISIESADS
jgi:hypothetical protein